MTLQCLQCTAHLSDTTQSVNRSGTPNLEVKSPAINWQRQDNAKVQTTRQDAAILTDSSNDELPAATIKLSLTALQMHLLLHCARRTMLHAYTVSVGVISPGHI